MKTRHSLRSAHGSKHGNTTVNTVVSRKFTLGSHIVKPWCICDVYM